MGFFQQNVVAVIWDFDNTIISGSMQDPLLRGRGITPEQFWLETNGLSHWYEENGTRVAQGSAYLNHMLTYVRHGKLAGLSNRDLREAGSDLAFFPGILEIMDRLTGVVDVDPYRKHDVQVEHYIVSTGLKEIIEGSPIRQKVKDVWASEFIGQPFMPGPDQPLPDPDHEISGIGYVIDDTSKTRAVFEINKGTNENPEIEINGVMAPEERRVPFENMICIADGPSDVPMFSVINQYGGKSFAVYNPKARKHFAEVAKLREQQRVLAAFPADYRSGGDADNWLGRAVRQVADAIVKRREALLDEVISVAPAHVIGPDVSDADEERMAASERSTG